MSTIPISVTNLYGFYITVPSRESLREFVSQPGATGRVSEIVIDFGNEVFYMSFDEFLTMCRQSGAEREAKEKR